MSPQIIGKISGNKTVANFKVGLIDAPKEQVGGVPGAEQAAQQGFVAAWLSLPSNTALEKRLLDGQKRRRGV